MGNKFSDFYEDEEEVSTLLEAADSGASRSSKDTQEFVDDTIERFEAYGLDAFISQSQLEWLKSLAEK